ncbi:hypothetical protein BU26DRAFT_567517 [Trematosphaeria pertusa]|uniref:Uncharacterized protein n=1 Tax=Trematosphaeria pertusa TaxID=390896 RepID=A0A6A6I909_9PLEO|nr:uncharacterized protein BU26DRAFT_567517 [Trematosphaeria pertusa]KAF2246003.1 hypothetical protein BU26DRAFT_567517 [Trematosphaeria pertusa]
MRLPHLSIIPTVTSLALSGTLLAMPTLNELENTVGGVVITSNSTGKRCGVTLFDGRFYAGVPFVISAPADVCIALDPEWHIGTTQSFRIDTPDCHCRMGLFVPGKLDGDHCHDLQPEYDFGAPGWDDITQWVGGVLWSYVCT